MENTISLCIPAYNASTTLPALFRSIKAQKTPFYEVLLYDDCSLDNTKELAESYGFKVVSGRENRGCSFGKNQLAKHATGHWLFF